jgi:hypothetical protein
MRFMRSMLGAECETLLGMRLRQRDPELASLGRRLCCRFIDVAWILGLMAGTLGATVVWDKARERGALEGLNRRLERWNVFMKSPRWRRVGPVVSVAAAVGTRNWRSPGARAMHVRRRDVRTGGPVTVRAALTGHLASQAQMRLVKRLLAPRRKRHEAQVRAIQDDLDAARREHVDDPRAQHQAMAAVYRAAGVNPLRGCSPTALVPAILEALVRLGTPRHQSLSDWVAGIVVVRD